MNTAEVVKNLVPLLGGVENIASATHCATRLRLVLHDDNKGDKVAIDQLDNVKGCFANAGQFQIIFGTGLVNEVYDEFMRVTQLEQRSKTEVNSIASQKQNIIQRCARTLSNIFVPIIPAIVASGLLMGLLGTLRTYNLVDSQSTLFVLLDIFSSSAFIILPILIGFTAAKEFGGNPYLGATLGGILTHPALTNAWSVAGGFETMQLLNFDIAMIGYQGTVFPVVLATWFMSVVEKNIRRVVPNALDIILTPFITVVLTGFVAMIFIGPAGRALGDGISWVLNVLYTHVGWFAGILFGGSYSAIVITGIHHSFHAIEAGLLTNPEIGINFLLPIWAMANVAQGGACLAVYFKTTNEKIKSIAVPSAVSSLLGITEAAIFGINLRFVKPFFAALAGGACGGGYVVFSKVGMTAVGLTGLPGMAIVQPNTLMHYIIGMVIAFVISFIISYTLKYSTENV
ncbi:sucrose-specific PTS transporter subunit IIBC [Zooshikella sp. RANM57]|uniref:sucrose-specific PTS transporter subunit IIBC n=1 Tax=Zooshikella sp. RANM57 TaxID=3425863 RepID=UPI003D6ECBF8